MKFNAFVLIKKIGLSFGHVYLTNFRASIKYFTYEKLDYIIVSVINFIIFRELLFNGYLDYGDFSTAPSFALNLNPLGEITGVTNNLGSSIGVSFSGPFTTLTLALLLLLFKSYYLNIFNFLYIMFFSYGLIYLSKTFTESKIISLISGIFGTYNGAVFNQFSWLPTAMFLIFLPWFLAFYYKYRISCKKFKYYILSILSIGFASLYGPSIPALFVTLLGIEIYSWSLNGNIISSIKNITLILISFIIYHLNVILSFDSTYKIVSNSFFPGETLKFSLVQILTFQVTMPWENLFKILLNYLHFTTLYTLYIFIILIYFIISVVLLSIWKKTFPLLLGILYIPLLGYQTNLLFMYTILGHISPAFVGIDPYEYDPLIAILYSVVLSNLIVYKNEKRIYNILLKYISIFAVVIIVISSIMVAIAEYQVTSYTYSHIDVPSGFVKAYRSVDNEIYMTVPTTYSLGFNYTVRNYSIFYGSPYFRPISVSFYWQFPSGFILYQNPVNINSISPLLVKMFNAYSENNSTEFRIIANEIGLKYIIWFNLSKMPLGFWPSYPYSWDINNLSKLIQISGFSLYEKYGNSVAILENPNILSYNISNNGIGYIIHAQKSNINKIITAIPYGSGYITLQQNGIKLGDKGGMLTISFRNNLEDNILVIPKTAIYNLITVLGSILYITLLLFYLRRIKHRGLI
ncbi:hypothetical protein [Sulfuracidifex tepidarius]|uniref:Uncharacterized protein n=1 Tax=Sulfuracidifex tepidarius TaxID=1294262 RepID=A0A510E1H0_9CREN|nr:hypothetical protein [Sulfuracidifex tepidarius]BBG25938.1 hypothetical protein IC007_0443 [Sulfuracidifex tepidarius]